MITAEQLLEPISPDAPSGEDLSFSPELDVIAQARKFDDPSLAQGEWITDLKEADWQLVVKRCAALLQEKSKDLRLAVWMTEAGARTDGLRGLGEGLRTLAGLCQDYWDVGLYPESDGDDHDQRTGNLSWILGRIPALVREIPLTDARHGAYTGLAFEVARKENGNGPGPRLADMEAARRNNGPEFLSTFTADVRLCLDTLAELEKVADERLGGDSPGFTAAREAIADLMRGMPTAGAPAEVLPAGAADTPSAEQAEDTTQSSHAAPAALSAPGPIQTRAQALAQLRLVAQFFRRTEPHSPVSYFADKAADAGEQNLHDWLRTVVKDEATMAHIEELLGVQQRG